MSQDLNNIFGGFISDTDKSLEAQSYNGVVFGLNQGVKVVRFEYTKQTGSGGSEGNPAIIVEVDFNGQKINTRFYNPDKVYKGKEEITDKTSAEYNKGYAQNINTTKGVLTHWCKALGVPEQTIATAFQTTPPTSFETLCLLFCNLAQPNLNNPIDIFMHYQKNLKSGAEKTYLEIPQNLAFGGFVTSAKPGTFKATETFKVKDGEGNLVEHKGLGYINEDGKQHPFKRDENYMKSTRATEQKAASLGNPGTPAGFAPNPMGQMGAAPAQNQMTSPNQAPQGNSATEEEW